MNTRHVLAGFGILAGVLLAAPQALSRDRPGTPLELKVNPAGPLAVDFRFFNTATELVGFEFEMEIDGQRLDRDTERYISAVLGGIKDEPDYVSGQISSEMAGDRLYPDTRFCLRVWSRTLRDVQSQIPSDWVCTVLVPDRAPPEPDLDSVKYMRPESPRDTRLRAELLIPPLTRDVAIDRLVIEHKDIRYPGWAYAFETEFKVRNSRNVEAYESVVFPSPKGLDGTHQFRVCLENAVGRACSSQRPMLAIATPKLHEQVRAPDFEVAPNDGRVNATRIEELNGKPLRPNVATVDPLREPGVVQTQSVEVNGGSKPLEPSAQQLPATKAATEPRTTMPASAASRATATAVRGQSSTIVETAANPARAPAQGGTSASVVHPAQATQAAVSTRRQTTLATPGGTSLAGGGATLQQPAGGFGSQPGTTANREAIAAASEIRTSEMICRGGPELRVESKGLRGTEGRRSALMHIYYSPNFSTRNAAGQFAPAGSEGEGLRPSTCGFLDRWLNADDPQGIHFDVTPHDAESEAKRMLHEANPGGSAPDPRKEAESRPNEKTIPLYLSLADHYWSFDVYRTNYGHFVAVAHRPWQPKSGTAIAGTARLGAGGDGSLAVGRLMSVKALPELRGVGFQFIARPNASPFIEIGREAPLQGRDGTWVLRNAMRMRADRDDAKSNATITTYVGSSAPQKLTLEPATQYHFLVNVPADGPGQLAQHAGTFRTLSRTAKVVFTGIHVLHDSDEHTDGDITFAFHANPNEPTHVQKRWEEQSWASGPRRRISEQLIVQNAPDRLRVVVAAYDDDKSQRDICKRFSLIPSFGELRPRKNNCGEINFAAQEFDLTKPLTVGGSFNLRSAGLGPHGVTLIYTVSGYVETTIGPGP